MAQHQKGGGEIMKIFVVSQREHVVFPSGREADVNHMLKWFTSHSEAKAFAEKQKFSVSEEHQLFPAKVDIVEEG